jgi:Concanavalin A-like lectin/glucanases superfamily
MSLGRGSLRPLALLLALAAPCCGRSSQITISFRVEDELFRPEHLVVSWLAPGSRNHERMRVPSGDGVLVGKGPAVASMVIDMDGAPSGARMILVWGMRGSTQVSGAARSLTWTAGSSEELMLTLGCVHGGEGPPPLDEPVDQAPWLQCQEPPPPPDPGPPDAGTGGEPDLARPAPDASAPDRPPPIDRASDLDVAALDSGPPPDSSPPDAPRPPADVAPDLPGREALPPGADLALGLVVYLRFDEGGSSIARDSSRNANQATLQQLDPATAWVSGYLGTAVDMAGRGWVRVEPSASLNTIARSFSISAWVNRTGDGTIVARRTSGGFLYRLFIAGGRLNLQINSAQGARVELVGTTPVPAGQWVHVVGVYDQLNARVYLSGSNIGQQPYQVPIAFEITPTDIGAAEDGAGGTTDRLLGALDEVAVYNRPLSNAEISGLADGHQPPAVP